MRARALRRCTTVAPSTSSAEASSQVAERPGLGRELLTELWVAMSAAARWEMDGPGMSATPNSVTVSLRVVTIEPGDRFPLILETSPSTV